MKKILFIVNPNAGKKKSSAEDIRQALSDQAIDYDIAITQHHQHAKQLAQQNQHQYQTFVAIGGDGTINEVINGIGENNTLGIIPMGSGNDFARSIDLPINDLTAALRIILKGTTKEVDIGEINGIRFINAVGIGFDGYANHLSQKIRWIKGGLKYIFAIAKAAIFYKPQEATLEINNVKCTTPIFMLSINNGKFVGNGLPTAPNAKLDDGQFNVIKISHLKRYRLATQFGRMKKGLIQSIPEVEHQLASELNATSASPLYIHYDGEAMYNTNSIHIKIHPKAIKLICP